MKSIALPMILFTCFAVGLPTWLMQNNAYSIDRVHSCTGECYERWVAETGGVVVVARAKAAEAAAASPVEAGRKTYNGCIACHGAGGEGGIGPQLAGQSADAIAGKLLRYRNGETVGPQSALMWGQAAALDDKAISDLAAFIATF